MEHVPHSFQPPKPQLTSQIEVSRRPDGVRRVELNTGADKITCVLRNGEPFIVSTTGPRDFSSLTESDQNLVRDALCRKE